MTNNLSEYVQGKLRSDAVSNVDFSANHEQLFGQLQRYANLREGARVLDVACGTGKWAAYLAAKGMTVHCADLQAEFLTVAQQRARKAGLTLDGVQSDGTALPYRDGSFDAVTLFSVLEHVPDWEGLMREAIRVLAPGGALWVTTTNIRCPVTDEIAGFPLFPWYPGFAKSRVMSWVQTNRPELIAHSPAPAVHWFTYARLNAFLEAHGCEQTATFVDYLEPSRGGWRVPLIQKIRGSKALRLAFEVVQPGCRLLTRKSAPQREKSSRPPRETTPVSSEAAEPASAAVLLSDELRSVLACPACKGDVAVSGREASIACGTCRLCYSLTDDVPVMLLSHARVIFPPVEAGRPVDATPPDPEVVDSETAAAASLG